MQPLTEPEHVVLLRETLRRFVANEMPRPLAREWDQQDKFPREVFARLASLGVMGLTVPEA
jgi:alkylation response protein AidB-like acyl-CoA dehydrogenase